MSKLEYQVTRTLVKRFITTGTLNTMVCLLSGSRSKICKRFSDCYGPPTTCEWAMKCGTTGCITGQPVVDNETVGLLIAMGPRYTSISATSATLLCTPSVYKTFTLLHEHLHVIRAFINQLASNFRNRFLISFLLTGLPRVSFNWQQKINTTAWCQL